MKLEKQYHDELNMELQGISYSESLSKKNTESGNAGEEERPEDGVETEEMAATDATSMSKVVMSRKKRKLYEAMQVESPPPSPSPFFFSPLLSSASWIRLAARYLAQMRLGVDPSHLGHFILLFHDFFWVVDSSCPHPTYLFLR